MMFPWTGYKDIFMRWIHQQEGFRWPDNVHNFILIYMQGDYYNNYIYSFLFIYHVSEKFNEINIISIMILLFISF